MPVFGALEADSLRFLLAQSRLVECAAGQEFFHEGDAADSMFVLERGRVVILRHWRGQDCVLHDLVAGDCFGEMAVMDLMPRSATVRALEACRAIEISAADFLGLFERDAEQFALVQMNIGREVCRRLRATDDCLFRARMGMPDALT